AFAKAVGKLGEIRIAHPRAVAVPWSSETSLRIEDVPPIRGQGEKRIAVVGLAEPVRDQGEREVTDRVLERRARTASDLTGAVHVGRHVALREVRRITVMRRIERERP